MVHFIPGLIEKREDLLGRPIGDLTEYISTILSILSTHDHTVVVQDDIKNPKEDEDNDATMDYVDEYELRSCVEKESVDKRITDWEAETL